MTHKVILLLLLVLAVLSSTVFARRKRVLTLAALGDAEADIAAKSVFTGIALQMGVKQLDDSTLELITGISFNTMKLFTALGQIGSVQINEDLYLNPTLQSVQAVFIVLSQALQAESKTVQALTQSLVQAFNNSNGEFQTNQQSVFQSTGIDSKLYLWGSCDYAGFEQYAVAGETIGKVIQLLTNFQPIPIIPVPTSYAIALQGKFVALVAAAFTFVL